MYYVYVNASFFVADKKGAPDQKGHLTKKMSWPAAFAFLVPPKLPVYIEQTIDQTDVTVSLGFVYCLNCDVM